MGCHGHLSRTSVTCLHSNLVSKPNTRRLGFSAVPEAPQKTEPCAAPHARSEETSVSVNSYAHVTYLVVRAKLSFPSLALLDQLLQSGYPCSKVGNLRLETILDS